MSVYIQIGVDDGKNKLKITLTIWDPDKMNNIRADKSKFSSKGAKKTHILAVACGVSESYSNLKILFNLCPFDKELSHKLSGDLKIQNILLGLQTHAALYPCGYCEEKKDFISVSTTYPLRTLASIEDHAKEWEATSGNRGDLKKYYSCEFKPLLDGTLLPINKPTLLLLPPPPLHLKLGIFNKIYTTMENHCEIVKEWSRSINCKKTEFHGGHFQGNEINKHLKNLNALENFLPQNMYLFHETLENFKDVIESCFGSDLDPYFEMVIDKFCINYRKLNIGITPKFHIVEKHLKQYIKMTGNPLGIISDQVVEAMHAEFERVLNKYRIKNIDHPIFHVKLLKIVNEMNSLHL